MSFFESFQATLTSFFPETMASLGDSEALSPYQVSPHLLNLPISLKRQITEAVEAY